MASLGRQTHAALSKHERHQAEELTFFSDLPPTEQAQLVDTIERRLLPNDSTYRSFCRATARQLRARIESLASERCAAAGMTCSQLKMEVQVASQGAATLLRQWPDRFSYLQMLPLTPLPRSLRRQVWLMRLSQFLPSIPLHEEELRSTMHDALVWDMCRNAVVRLGLPHLAGQVLSLKVCFLSPTLCPG